MLCPAIPNKSRDWEQKIQQQKQSGLSVSCWCQENQVPYNTFVYWKRRFVKISSLERKSFVELEENSPKSGIQHYGVSHNSHKVSEFLFRATKIMFKWLNRRGQRRSFNWEKFNLFMKIDPLPKAKIVHKLTKGKIFSGPF